METVTLIIERRSEDYHGSYDTVIAVYGDENKAREKVKELEDENFHCNIEYFIDVCNVE